MEEYKKNNKDTKINFDDCEFSFHLKDKQRTNNRRENKYRDKNKYDRDYYDNWN